MATARRIMACARSAPSGRSGHTSISPDGNSPRLAAGRGRNSSSRIAQPGSREKAFLRRVKRPFSKCFFPTRLELIRYIKVTRNVRFQIMGKNRYPRVNPWSYGFAALHALQLLAELILPLSAFRWQNQYWLIHPWLNPWCSVFDLINFPDGSGFPQYLVAGYIACPL